MMDRKLLLIVGVGVVLRLLCFVGLVGSDDLIYNEAAYNLMAGKEFALGNPGQNRLGLILPLTGIFKLLGVNEVSSSLVTLIPSIILIFLTYHMARFFFGKVAGYIGAMLQAVYPMDVLYATMLYPDLPVGFLTGLSVYLFHRACHDKGDHYLFLSGLCAGFAYLVKMTGAFAIPFLIAYATYNLCKGKGIRWGFLLTPIGFLVVFIPELLFFYITKGDMLFRFHSLSVHNEGPWSGLSFYLTHGYFERLTYMYPRTLLFNFRDFALFYWFTFVAMAYLLAVKEKKAYFPIVWWSALFLTLNFGSTSLSRYIPLFPLSRYSFMLLLPANLILACALGKLAGGETSPRWARAISYSATIILVLSSIYMAGERDGRGSSFNERAIKAYFGGQPTKVIYTDSRTIKILEYYFEYKNREMLKDFKQVEWGSVRDSYVIVNFPRLRFLNKYYGWQFDPVLLDPPPSWRPVALFNRDKGADERPLLNGREAIVYHLDQ